MEHFLISNKDVIALLLHLFDSIFAIFMAFAAVAAAMPCIKIYFNTDDGARMLIQFIKHYVYVHGILYIYNVTLKQREIRQKIEKKIAKN